MTSDTSTPIRINRSSVFAALPPERMRSEHTLAACFLVGFSVLVFLLAGGFLLSDWQWRQTALRAEAEVLEIVGTKTPRARVRFIDADGVEHNAEASGPFNGIRATVGERITVLYQRGSTAYVSHDDPQRHWIGPALFAGFACLPLLPLPFMQRQVRRQEQRYARLRQLGLKRAVDAARTERVPWGKFTRWTIVATWRDSLGRSHQTLTGPYTYDPAPVDSAQLIVLSDSQAPEQSVIAPETLPDFSHSGRGPSARTNRDPLRTR